MKVRLPEVVEVETSRTCNLKCATCPRNKHPVGPLYLTPSIFNKILDGIPTVKKIYLIGGGEPLLNPYLSEILETARKRSIKVGINTNGMLVTSELIKEWKVLDLWRVFVSLDSFNQELLDKLRPGASVEKIQTAVKLLVGSNIEVGLNTLRYNSNISEKRNILDWCWTLGIGVTFINPIYSKNKEQDLIIGRPPIWLPLLLEDRRKWGCISQPYILLEGKVYTCPFMPLLANGNGIKEYFLGHKVETTLDNFYMGNMLTTNFLGIWEGDRYKNFRQGFNGVPKTLTKEEFIEMRLQKPIKETVQEYCASCTARWGVSCEA